MGTSAITGINLGVPGYQQDFTVGPTFVVSHGFNSQYVDVTVYNNSDQIVIPDEVTATDVNTSTVDMTSYGTLTPTYRVVCIDKGATVQINPTPTDLNISGQVTDDRLVYSGAAWVRKEAAAFKANLGTNVTNMVTDGLNYNLVFDNELWDIGSNYNIADGKFTAPVAGIYSASMTLMLIDVDTAATSYDFRISHYNSSDVLQTSVTERWDANKHSVDWNGSFTLTSQFQMTATDYLVCVRKQSGGAAQTDIDNGDSFFSGYLIA